MDGRSLAAATSPTQFNATRSPMCRPFTTIGAGKGVSPSPTYSKQAWPTLKKRVPESNLVPYSAYATPGSSAVDLWKRLARKAELEWNLEVDCHRADNAKNNATIHRLNRRLVPLEKALGKAKEALKHQEKLMKYLKCQLMAAEGRKNMDISYLQSRNEALQKRLAGASQTNDEKILELQEELRQADSRAETLQAQINEIYKNIDDEPDKCGSGTRPRSPASPKDRMGSGKKVHGQNKQDMGLVAVAKIYKMRLSKEYLKEKLAQSEEEITLLVQENDRLRKLAQDAVARSNQFLELAQTLKADRDLTMSRLSETEDNLKSLEALKDSVHSYLKTTSPRLGDFLPARHFWKSLHNRQEDLPSSKNTEDVPEIVTDDLPTTRSDCDTKAVYFQGDVGAGAQSIGETLVKKLQDVFQVLACKVETANQTVKSVKKEEEKLRMTMLEAFQELRGQKGSKLNTADDVALGVLVAVRDVKQTLEGLEKEKARFKASESMEDEKIMLLQSQVNELSMDRLTLLESLESVKNAIKAANAGHEIIQHEYVKGFFHRRIIQGENISEVVEMVGKLISERDEARSMGGGLMQDKLLKEKELSDLRKMYAQTQTLTTHLQVEKDLLKKERNELKTTCEDLKRQKGSWNAEKKGEYDKNILGLKTQIQDLILDRAALLETLEAIKKALGTSETRDEAIQYLKGFQKRSVIRGRNVAEVVEMIEDFVIEKEEAKLKESLLMEEREIINRELDEIKRLFAQSQSLCVDLEEEKNILHSKLHEFQKFAHALKTEKESMNTFSIEMEKKIAELQTQLHDLTQGCTASRETLKTLKSTLRGADSIALAQSSEDYLLEDEDGSQLLAMAEKVVKERNEARLGGRKCEEEMEMKEREMSDLRHLYAESKRFSESLQSEKDELEKRLQSLDVEKEDAVRRSSHHLEKLRRLSSSSQQEVNELRKQLNIVQSFINTVSTELRKLYEIMIPTQMHPTSVMENRSDPTAQEHIKEDSHFREVLRDLPSVVEEVGKLKIGQITLEQQLQSLELEKQDAVRRSSQHLENMQRLSDCSQQDINELREQLNTFQSVINSVSTELRKLYEIMIPTEMNLTSLKENTSELTAEEHRSVDSDLRQVIRDLPRVVEEVGKLKMRHIALEQQLQSVELEKQDAVRRSSQHLENMQRLSDCSQQEVTEMREKLNAVQSFISSVLVERTAFKTSSSEDTSSKQRENANSLFSELELIRNELIGLRTEKAHLEITVGDLQSKEGSAEDKLRDLAMKLSSAEAQVQTFSSSALAANSRILSVESQYAAAETQLSELFGLIHSKDSVQGSGDGSSTSELRTTDMDVATIITAIQNKVSELFLASEDEVSKRAREATKWKLQQEALEKDSKLSTAEVERLREKLTGQAEFIKKHTAEWTKLVENLKREIIRLGGSDLRDEGDKRRISLAAEKVKELLAPALSRNPSSSAPQTSADPSPSCNPLLGLATFHVDLLVNNKVHSQLKVSGQNGGLCQAAFHYFYVDGKTGGVTFENAVVRGSQSSNLVVDVFMQPVDSKKGYQTHAGDVLGLRVKLSDFSDPSPREVLNSTSVIRTDEVLEAIQGQTILNFSLWPDIVSSWRWERDVKKKKWSLVGVRWRFLLKNIFPDLSAPLQDLTIKGAEAPH